MATVDVMTNPDNCLRDAALFQKLGINTVRILGIDPTGQHDECFSIFDSVGIYVMITLSWNNSDPTTAFDASTSSAPVDQLYTLDYLASTFRVIDAVKNYENVLGFVVADDYGFDQEVLDERLAVDASMYMKVGLKHCPVPFLSLHT